MNVDLLKSALSGDVRKDVTQALEGDRMVTFKGDVLLGEQKGGGLKQFHLGEFFAPSKGGIQKLVYRYVKVKG